jgi:hypothetical protein
MTYNQNAFTASIPAGFLPDNNSYHSIDLTAATDRMPITLQKRVVEYLYGSASKSSCWERILVGHPYNITLRDNNQTTSMKISYGAGQPMGAYSS